MVSISFSGQSELQLNRGSPPKLGVGLPMARVASGLARGPGVLVPVWFLVQQGASALGVEQVRVLGVLWACSEGMLMDHRHGAYWGI